MNQQEVLAAINADAIKTDLPRFDIGDTLNVHQRIVEGDKERIQVYSGVLISRKGGGMNEMITVRRIVDNIGVDKVEKELSEFR